MSDQNFYRAFEDRYRGSRELIKDRLRVYLPFIQPLISEGQQSSAIDLGCGRGEWLETLSEAGITALGVDLDDGMLSACSERGLKVVHGDAIAYLSAFADDSQIVVSAFHMVEHISFDQLRQLVQEAHRVLKPGGLLIMETPNPENIMVATYGFHLDPTHVKPIPPDLLLFITEFYNFYRSKIVRVQEWSEIKKTDALSLEHVLTGASPDYAVVAQKNAPADVLGKCEEAFCREYGVDLNTLANKYHAQQSQKIRDLQSKLEQAERSINGIYTSFLWRVVEPIRWIGRQYRKLKNEGLSARLKGLAKKIYHRTLGRVIVFKDPESSLRRLMYQMRNRQSNVSTPAPISRGSELSIDAQKIYSKLKKEGGNADSD